MTVYLVGAGPGDPGLLTRRGEQLLSRADVVLFDRLVHHSVLALAPESAELIDVGKMPGGGVELQAEINRLLIDHGKRRSVVVRLKGGDPFVFGRGGEEGEALDRAGVRWEVVPGVSSAFGVPASVGIPVTHRGVAASVTVVTGRMGDPTATGGVDWDVLAKVDGTLVILMGMMNRADIAVALQRGGKPASTPTAVIARGTTPDQAVVRTTLGQLADVTLSSPGVIVVGAVAALGDAAPPRRAPGPLSGRTVVVTRSGPRAAGLVEALRRAGAEALEVPLTEQAAPADGGAALRAAASRVAGSRWVVFTSVNAVERFMGELRDARALGACLVAAVGPATADALRAAGLEADLVPEAHSATGLVTAFPVYAPIDDRLPTGNRVLFPAADLAPTTIVDGLTGKGWEVEQVEAYRTVPLAPPPEALRQRMAGADAVTFAASSAVSAYADLKGPDGAALRVPRVVVCIGPSTAAQARADGMTGVEEAGDPSSEGIVGALTRRLADRPADRPADGS